MIRFFERFQRSIDIDKHMHKFILIIFQAIQEQAMVPPAVLLHMSPKVPYINKNMNRFILNIFQAIQEQMMTHGADLVSFEDVKDEIFDMVKPADPTKITLQDIISW